MATIFEDDFNSYNDGDLNSQGGWTASSGVDVQGTVVKEGAKAVKFSGTGADETALKSGSSVATGKKTFYFRQNNNTNTEWRTKFEIKSGSTTYCRGYVNGTAGKFTIIQGYSTIEIGNLAVDTWHCIEIEWDCTTDQYRARVDGGAWSSWGNFDQNRKATTLSSILFTQSSTSGYIAYLDYIAEEPISGGEIKYGSATLSGVGSLSAAAKVIRTASATLAGTGALSAASKVTRLASATLSGTGSLSAAGTVTGPAIYGSATLSGTGALSAAGTVIEAAVVYGSATVSGIGTLAVAGKVTRTAKATLAGTGSLSASAVYIVIAKATLAGEGTLVAVGTVIPAAICGSATLSGVGYLTAAGQIVGVLESLIAAQKKPHRLPYVEAKVYDYEAGIKRLTWTRLYDGSTPWRTPTGHNDPDNAWTDEEKAYDDTDSTHATKQGLVNGEWTPFLELTHDALMCDKVRFLLNNTDFDLVDVDVYYESAWHDVYQGVYDAYPTWNEKDIPDGLKSVTKARLRARATITAEDHGCWFHELDFGVLAGLEPDNYHGIAFDGQGSMHRIRAAADNKLYYQKVTDPDESSDYSQWTEFATDCDGPCAIAAYGAKVYIFYKTTGNVLWKYYSHDYGQTWDDAQLVSYADVLSLAACWWGTGNIVVCFALKSNQLNGITLDTSTQTATPHTWSDSNHPLLATYGIGATYNPFWPAIEVVFAGKESDSPYNHYDLFRTKFSDTYNFLALESFLMAPDGEDITYEYPDCHLPASAQPYETNRIVAVEKFAGTTAYTRPLACHMVKGTYWSDTTFTEPKPFLNISSSYGLRLQSTGDYWWMERPDGVWRAPRPAGSPIDLTKDIVSLTQRISSPSMGDVVRGFSLVLELDNSKGQYVPIPSGFRFRSEIVLKLGYKTPDGDLALEAGTYWIDSWEYSSKPNMSRFILTCLDGWGLMDRWTARYQMRWNKDEVNPKSVWQILYQLLARAGIKLTNTPPKPQSSAINNFYPDFTINPGTQGDSAIRKLLSFVPDRLVFRGQEAFTKNPLADEESCYSYGTDHVILAGQYRQAVTLSRSRALGRDDSDDRILEEALDWDLLQLAIDILEQDYDPNLQTAARAQERADAILRTRAQEAELAVITIGTNVGQELLDVVEVTDVRCGVDQEKYRVQAIQTDYDRRQGRYEQRLTIGAP